MIYYLGSVLISTIVTQISDAVINLKVKKKGYLSKKFRKTSFSKADLLLHIIPGVNLIWAIFESVATVIVLKNDELLLKITENARHSATNVKGVYEARPIKKDVLKDAMVLDGADEKTIADEMKTVDKLLKGISVDNGEGFNWYEYAYTEEEYKWACAQYNAEQLLEELMLSVSLTEEQKAQLLQLFRESYLDEMKGSEKDIMERALNIVK